MLQDELLISPVLDNCLFLPLAASSRKW